MSGWGEAKPAAKDGFTFDKSLEPWNIHVNKWLIQNHKYEEWDGIATGCIVFDDLGRVLIIKRASHDSLPNKWEFPGGATDDIDPTILHGAARELYEESGLVARRFTHIVTEAPGQEPGHVFQNSKKTSTWCRFTFVAEIDAIPIVTLDPKEHQDYAWASEQQIRNQKVGNTQIDITFDNVKMLILEAFRLRKAAEAS